MLKTTVSSDVTNDLDLDQSDSQNSSVNSSQKINIPKENQLPPPPQGDEAKAQQYIEKLTVLVQDNKLVVTRTDLKKFEINDLQDHYFVNLGEYEVEVSHSKQPDSGKDFYVLLFNNIKRIEAGCTNKIILAYTHLTEAQFKNFKTAADGYLEKKRKEAEAKKFKEALTPIDNILENLALGESSTTPAVNEEPDQSEPIYSQS